MQDDAVIALELAEVATSSLPLPRRAEDLLAGLRRAVPFDGAWLALADPHHPHYTTLGSTDLADSTRTWFAGPPHAGDIEAAGAHRDARLRSHADSSRPITAIPTWAECLLPAGYREALGGALFACDGRHVGFIALLSANPAFPPLEARRLMAYLTPVLAHGIDPMHALAAAAHLVHAAYAGVVLHEDGAVTALPGLPRHALLAAGSPTLAAARAVIDAGRFHASFLWPLGGRHAPDGHARVTALARTRDLPVRSTAAVLVSPPGDLRGLTTRELEVLGLLIDGHTNAEIAHTLVLAPRTVAAHLEHILTKLAASSRTLAAVRAERAGLFVPPEPRLPAGRR